MEAIIEFSAAEALLGAEYAAEEYGFILDQRLLRILANQTRRDMQKFTLSFEDSRRGVLNEANFRPASDERRAFSGALGKMFNRRRNAKKRAGKPKISAPRLPNPNVFSEKNGQRAWKF